MKVSARLCTVALATLLLPACATITRGTKENYVIESTPAAAEVALSTGQTCVTPCKLKLKRKDGFTATFTKAGYDATKVEVKSKFSGGGAAAGAGNVLVGGIIGAVVDGTNGSLNDLKPNPLQVTLAASSEPENSIGPVEAAPAVAEVPAAAPITDAAAAPQPKPNAE
jgi:hypothetical protein